MQVLVQTDNQIDNREELSSYVQSVVIDAIDRFGEHVTSVQVHLHDDNSAEKKGDEDKRCMMEARLTHLKPIAVSQLAGNLHQAINGAADKLQRTLQSTLEKLEDRKRRAVGTGHLDAPDTGSAPPTA
jgi:ribosomal subunit interface protein